MRYILLFWALPLGLFWGWYFLSLNDISFGYLMLSRQVHDFAFAIYGDMLGVPPQDIPPLVAKACVVDTLLILGIFGVRRRAAIRSRLRQAKARYFAEGEAPSA